MQYKRYSKMFVCLLLAVVFFGNSSVMGQAGQIRDGIRAGYLLVPQEAVPEVTMLDFRCMWRHGFAAGDPGNDFRRDFRGLMHAWYGYPWAGGEADSVLREGW
jgi:hypothetical protein